MKLNELEDKIYKLEKEFDLWRVHLNTQQEANQREIYELRKGFWWRMRDRINKWLRQDY